MKQINNVGIGYYKSPLGYVKIVEQDATIISTRFINFIEEPENETPLIKKCKTQLNEYFLKQRTSFNLPILITGTTFQKKVYEALTKIPYGQTRSYHDVAVSINHSSAYRAVGNANNKNKLFLLVPCHRVTKKDNTLSGEKDWVKMQQWLIDFEKGK